MIFISEPVYLSIPSQGATSKRAHSPCRRRRSVEKSAHKHTSSVSLPKKAAPTPKYIPPTDIFETPTTYNLEVALPGVSKDKIEVEWVADYKLVIKARNSISDSVPESEKEGEQEPPQKKRKYWLSERTYGEFVKEVMFPEDIDLESTSVRLNAGLLHVEVNKAEKKKRGKVQVEYLG